MELCLFFCFFFFFLLFWKNVSFLFWCVQCYVTREKKCFLSFVPFQSNIKSLLTSLIKKINKIKNILFILSYFSIILHFLSATIEKKNPLSINPREEIKKKKKKSFYHFQKCNKNLNADFVKKVLFNLFVFRQDFLSWEGGWGEGVQPW